MEQFANVLYVIGGIVGLIGCIGLVIDAFHVSLLWGFGCLIFMPAMLAFVIVHWEKGKRSFFIWMIGLAMFFLAVLMGSQ